MNDETTIVMVIAGAFLVLVFVAVQIRSVQVSRQHSLGDMYQPLPKHKEPPITPHR